MTDYDRQLYPGEQQTIRRGAKPAGGWVNRGIINLDVGQQALITGSDMPRKKPSGGSGGGTAPPPPDPPPDPPPAPETSGIQGFARVAMVAAGIAGGSLDVDNIHTKAADATLITCSTFAQLKTALQASGKRFIKVTGSALLDGGGTSFNVTNPLFTVDFSFYTGPGMKDYKILVKCGDNIWTQGAMRPGEGSSASASADRRAISFNSGGGAAISRIALDHMSLAWGPDVTFSALNGVHDMTVQYSLIGPCLYESNIASSPNGYGPNITNSAGGAGRVTRFTYYRNLMPLNHRRNLRIIGGDKVDAVNNVIYDYEIVPGEGNPVGANLIGNVFKKGPQTPGSTLVWNSDPLGGNDTTLFANAVWVDDNIGVTAAGGSFTPTYDFVDGATDAERATPYDQLPSHATHGALTIDTADAALVTDVVANAGRTYEDATDALMKSHTTAGTDDGGYYNGAGFAAPHPSWP